MKKSIAEASLPPASPVDLLELEFRGSTEWLFERMAERDPAVQGISGDWQNELCTVKLSREVQPWTLLGHHPYECRG